ncbi:MAG: PilZ domain-containing protein [Sulfurimonas sp.]|nr:PilZ domain-containing protein [Sulfurimonas sp.]
MVHIFYKTSTSKQILEISNTFESIEKLDISGLKTIENYDVYFVEIDKVEKEILLHIKQLLSNKTESLIYFFINDSHSLMLFQLSALLNVKTIITQKSDMTKILESIKKDIAYQKVTRLEHVIADTMIHDHCFMIFDSNKLKYVSQKLYDDFSCKNLDDVKLKVCTQFKLGDLLNNIISFEDNVAFTSNSKIYNIDVGPSTVNSDKFIYLETVPESVSHNNIDVDFIKNRIYFIEVLKEKILEKSMSDSKLGVITIQVENIEKLKDDWKAYDIEESIHDLLLEINGAIQSHDLLAQYDNGLYLILFDGLDFEAVKSKALTIQNHILTYIKDKKIKPIVGLYALDVNNLELNETLEIISNLSRDDVSIKDINAHILHKIINVNDEMDDREVIDILLQAIFTNKSPIKLINIYKGLCINTSSVILRTTVDEVDVTFQQLQGTVMNFEKSTVIQSSSFSKDIVADVVHINVKKKFARLNNFRFAQGSANSRKYSRVTCSQRTPITVFHDKGTLNGSILDISMNSIAIKTRLYDNIESLELSVVTLNFTLPDNSIDGYVKLSLEAEVKFIMCDKDYCKVIVDLYENQASESILMEYVYNRQKEIIIELRRQSSFL